MNLLTGYMFADRALRESAGLRECAAGEIVFEEGSPADALFVVVQGRIEIVRTISSGEVKLSEVGPNGVFGEMGLLGESGVRAATARAIEPSVLLAVQGDPVTMLRDLGEVQAALTMVKKLVCVLGDWLREMNQREASNENDEARFGITAGSPGASAAIKASLPKGFLRLQPKQATLSAGEFLCRQGDKPRGFYFIHSGTLAILRQEEKSSPEAKIGAMRGPTVAGEVGYFSGQRRLATLQALDEVTYSYFPGEDYEALEETQPEKALDLLLAAARSIIHLIRSRNT